MKRSEWCAPDGNRAKCGGVHAPHTSLEGRQEFMPHLLCLTSPRLASRRRIDGILVSWKEALAPQSSTVPH